MQDREAAALERGDVELRIEPGRERDHRRDGRIVGDVDRDRAAHREAEQRDLRGAGLPRRRDRGAGVLDAAVDVPPRLDPVAHLEKGECRMARGESLDEPLDRGAPGSGHLGGGAAVDADDRARARRAGPASLGAGGQLEGHWRTLGKSPWVDTATAIDRFLASPALAESTRRAYASDLRGFEDWLAERGTASRTSTSACSPSTRPSSGALGTGSRRRRSPAGSRPSGRSSASRSARHAFPTPRSGRGARSGCRKRRSAPRSRRSWTRSTGTGRSAPQRRARRARLLGRAAQRRGGRARPRRRRLRAGARSRPRQGRQGARRPARRGGVARRRALPARRPAGARARRQRCALPLRPRPAARHEHAPPAPPPPAPAAPLVRDAPARGRRRPADDPGAARPLVALDDPGLQPRRREAPPEGL